MSLVSTYKEYILENIMFQYLQDGIIPSAETLEAKLTEYMLAHPDLSLPASKFSNFNINRIAGDGEGVRSSAGLINNIINTFSNDITILTRELYGLAQSNESLYNRWIKEIERLVARAKTIEARIDNLLLLANDTEGYFAAFSEVLADLAYVDTENTTALVDILERTITISPGSISGKRFTVFDTSNLTINDISFYPLTKRSGTKYYNASQSSTLDKILKFDTSSWSGVIVSSSPGPMIAELKIRLSNTDTAELTKITIDSSAVTISSSTTITPQYSEDGYSWSVIPALDATKVFVNKLSWSFSPVAAKWVKFIINKPQSDGGQYQYLYNIKNIKFYGNSYYTEDGDYFYSSALSVNNQEDTEVTFTKVELDVCETIPDSTSIEYYLSASKDNSTWTEWHPVYPASRNEKYLPSVVNFSSYTKTDNLSSSVELLNSSHESSEVVSLVDAGGVVFPNVRDGSYGLINTMISVPANINYELVANSIEAWRNVRVQDVYPDTDTVNSVPRGWRLDGDVYSCYFEIVTSAGFILNLGNTVCILDGQEVTGSINVLQGVHKFETLSNNWLDLSGNFSTSPTNEESIKSIDSLYPYNHKYLIEGFKYSSLYSGNKVYLGTDKSAEYYCRRVSLFDLENNNPGRGTFAIKNIGTSSTILGVILNRDLTNSDFTNERCIVSWSQFNGDSELYKYIKLKAILNSEDIAKTPVITAYKVKLGI